MSPIIFPTESERAVRQWQRSQRRVITGYRSAGYAKRASFLEDIELICRRHRYAVSTILFIITALFWGLIVFLWMEAV